MTRFEYIVQMIVAFVSVVILTALFLYSSHFVQKRRTFGMTSNGNNVMIQPVTSNGNLILEVEQPNIRSITSNSNSY